MSDGTSGDGEVVNKDINNRWERGVDHHPESIKLFNSLEEIDSKYGNFAFDWRSGGDGDNGEELMFHLDIYFECKDSGVDI